MTAGRAAPATATCGWCKRAVRVRNDGHLQRHFITLPVSRRAVGTIGRGSTRARCAGSGTTPGQAPP